MAGVINTTRCAAAQIKLDTNVGVFFLVFFFVLFNIPAPFY